MWDERRLGTCRFRVGPWSGGRGTGQPQARMGRCRPPLARWDVAAHPLAWMGRAPLLAVMRLLTRCVHRQSGFSSFGLRFSRGSLLWTGAHADRDGSRV